MLLMSNVKSHMKSRLSWSTGVGAALCILGLAYAVVEGIVPSLRPGPPQQVAASCAALGSASSITEITGMAKERGWKSQVIGSGVSVQVGSGCVCALELAQGRVSQHRTLCNG